jgi:hypothetical protein
MSCRTPEIAYGLSNAGQAVLWIRFNFVPRGAHVVENGTESPISEPSVVRG